MSAKAATSTRGTSRAMVDPASLATSSRAASLPGSRRPQRDEAAMRSEHSRPGSEPQYQGFQVLRFRKGVYCAGWVSRQVAAHCEGGSRRTRSLRR